MNALPDADKALCIAYIDGLLDERARIEFELRLAREPELAAVVGAALRTDEMLRRLAAREGSAVVPRRRSRVGVWLVALAVAAAVLVAVALHLLTGGGAPRCEVALAPGFEAARDYIAAAPELAGLRPSGVDVLRGADEAPNVEVDAFAAKAALAERRMAGEALAAKRTSLAAGYFVIPLKLGAPASVVVFAVDGAGRASELFPAERGEAAASLSAGAHVLPEERFATERQSGAPRLRYARGFLVPLGARALDVVVGVRAGPLAPGLRALPEVASADALGMALEQRGFAVTRLHVDEPR